MLHFFTKFLHYLFGENFPFFHETDWSEILQKIEHFPEICNISAKRFSFWLEIGSAILTFIGYKQTDKQIIYDSPYKIFFTWYGLLAS